MVKRRTFLMQSLAAGAIAGLRGETVGGNQGDLRLLTDTRLTRGCVVWDPAPGQYVATGTLTPYPDLAVGGRPAWGVAQWHSHFTLAGATPEPLPSGAVRFFDGAKAVTFGAADTAENGVTLSIDGNAEYGGLAPVAGAAWPHLLLSAVRPAMAKLDKLASLRLRISYRLIQNQPVPVAGWNPQSNPAHFLFYMTVQNLNRASKGYGDYYWCGLSLFDTRYSFSPAYQSPDLSTEAKPGTGKYIFQWPMTRVVNSSAHDLGWVTIDADLLPMAEEGLNASWAAGFLADSRDVRDYYVGFNNIGWETLGPIKAAIQIREWSLDAGVPAALVDLNAYTIDTYAPVPGGVGTHGLVFDSKGRLYVSGYGAHVVRLYSPTTGQLTTFAGTGTAGYSGDGGRAEIGALNAPRGLAIDANDNLYIADTNNNAIRRVSPAGTVMTFAAASNAMVLVNLKGPTGVFCDSAGHVFVSDSGNNRVVLIANGVGTEIVSGLKQPADLAVDLSEVLYVADKDNHRVLKVTPEPVRRLRRDRPVSGDQNLAYRYQRGRVETIAGTGASGLGANQLNAPQGVAVDNEGRVYIADSGNARILKIDSAGNLVRIAGTGTLGTSANGTLASATNIGNPLSLAVDKTGNIYFTDFGFGRVAVLVFAPVAGVFA